MPVIRPGCPARANIRCAMPGDELETLGVRVDEPELLDRQRVPQPGEAVDELGGVGGATPDDREFH